MAKLVTNGGFYVVAAAEKGARPEMVYWDECPSGFKFCSGVNGEEVYHIVYNSRKEAGYKDIRTPFLCVVSHTKNSTYPSDDVKNNGANAKWKAFNTQALIATDLMLARKILAGEIDVDSLTVRNVSAVSSDGNTTCTIDGETGKLSAKNSDFEGVNAVNMTATNVTAKNMSVDGITATNADISGKITASTGSIGNLTILGSGSTIGGNLNIENASTGSWNISSSSITNIVRNNINHSRVFALAFGTGTVKGTYTVYLPKYSDILIDRFNIMYSYSFELNLFVPTKFCWNTEGIGYIAPITANNATYRITPSSGSTLYNQNGSAVDYYDLTKGDFIKLLGLFIRESSTSTPYIDYYVISLRQ